MLFLFLILLMPPAPQPAAQQGVTAVRESVVHAGEWLARFPEENLRFDAAIGLHGIRQRIDSEQLRTAWNRALPVAERDVDNPMLRFWNPGVSSPQEVTAGWKLPGPGEPRVNTNRVISEALHCRENGWRPETTAYIIGPMRDAGGYHTVHGLWALTIAREQGCLQGDRFTPAAAPLLEEIRNALAGAPEPRQTLEIDLFAERLLMTLLADPAAANAPEWAGRLLALQNKDGSWGLSGDDERPYYRYHATMASAWALAVYVASNEER